ncbi:MAG: type II toxin-antitoxin system RelE/ParE family toxin [Elusimicrobia bacterium]|nr:type II toxin-antitoxin system RelE/ParE family toxin [Candidatus Liberimonas magnetica]
MYKIRFYRNERGNIPVMDFLEGLTQEVRAKLYKRMELLQQQGTMLRRPYADKLKDKIYELRASFGRLEIRLLYFYSGREIIITHGFFKKTNHVPEEEIQTAKNHMQNFYKLEGRILP